MLTLTTTVHEPPVMRKGTNKSRRCDSAQTAITSKDAVIMNIQPDGTMSVQIASGEVLAIVRPGQTISFTVSNAQK